MKQAIDVEELMDADDLPADTYAAVVGDLARVNVVTMAARPTLAFLARAATGGAGLRLLDVGFGDGDMLRRIARWAARRALPVELVGVDLNGRSEPAARAHTPAELPIRYVTGDYADLGGEAWDVVISSLVAHHMTPGQLVAFLRWMEEHARAGWFVNDLHRHRFARESESRYSAARRPVATRPDARPVPLTARRSRVEENHPCQRLWSTSRSGCHQSCTSSSRAGRRKTRRLSTP